MTENIHTEAVKAQMRKGMLEFAVLLIISRGKMYASEILAKLTHADLIVVEGTLYPLLSRLKTDQLVTYTWEESKAGPPRKYYTLTPEGENYLRELSKAWKGLYASIQSLIK